MRRLNEGRTRRARAASSFGSNRAGDAGRGSAGWSGPRSGHELRTVQHRYGTPRLFQPRLGCPGQPRPAGAAVMVADDFVAVVGRRPPESPSGDRRDPAGTNPQRSVPPWRRGRPNVSVITTPILSRPSSTLSRSRGCRARGIRLGTGKQQHQFPSWLLRRPTPAAASDQSAGWYRDDLHGSPGSNPAAPPLVRFRESNRGLPVPAAVVTRPST